MPTTAQRAAQAIERFNEWVVERDRVGDWPEYVRGGKLNRSELSKECNFGRAALQQNPGLASALATLEVRLAEQGILSQPVLTGRDLTPEQQAHLGAADEQLRRSMAAKAASDKRLKALEEQNAALRAENSELRERLRRTALAELHLAETGRLLPP
ncbi:MAG: hypothetical protein EKK53_28230 [Burkholderiales bacterium]|jgi:hypothetical protein|nr:MAG: hypothetical protein EKK53_28230 [Burkholderiales bacterium]